MAESNRPPSTSLVAVRIVRPYATEDEFLEQELETIGKTSVLLLGAHPRPAGVILRFEVTLVGGATLLRGEGRVLGHRENAFRGQPGLTLRFTRLDHKSKALVDRAAAIREARLTGDDIPVSAIPHAPSAPPGSRAPSVAPISAAEASRPAHAHPPALTGVMPTDSAHPLADALTAPTPMPATTRARSSYPPPPSTHRSAPPSAEGGAPTNAGALAQAAGTDAAEQAGRAPRPGSEAPGPRASAPPASMGSSRKRTSSKPPGSGRPRPLPSAPPARIARPRSSPPFAAADAEPAPETSPEPPRMGVEPTRGEPAVSAPEPASAAEAAPAPVLHAPASDAHPDGDSPTASRVDATRAAEDSAEPTSAGPPPVSVGRPPNRDELLARLRLRAANLPRERLESLKARR